LNSEEMTSRACRLMITLAVSLAIVLVPIAAAAFIIMVKAPADWKYMLAGGSTVFITVGSWVFGHRKAPRKSRRSLAAADTSQEPTQGI
jgi:O-antigen/teichoic acid export membrane protein